MFTGQSLISLILTYRYAILFPLACIEGPVLALVVGFLVSAGYFNFWLAFLVMCAGDLIPDLFYYYLGRWGQSKKVLERFGSRSQFVTKHFSTIEGLWRDHGFKTMFLSKLAYGLSTPLLISSGLAKMSLKHFVGYAFPVTLFQYAVIMALGYYLGSSYSLATQYIKSAEIILAGAAIIFILIYLAIQKYARRQIEKLEKEEEKN